MKGLGKLRKDSKHPHNVQSKQFLSDVELRDRKDSRMKLIVILCIMALASFVFLYFGLEFYRSTDEQLASTTIKIPEYFEISTENVGIGFFVISALIILAGAFIVWKH